MTENSTNEVYAVFAGNIDQNSIARIFNNMAGAMAARHSKMHLLFQSTGGIVGDGVCLYNFFRTLPLPLVIYNAGTCASIAAIAYLGARERKASAKAAFMLHRTTGGAQSTNAQALRSMAESIILDDVRTEGILRDHIGMPARRWRQLKTSSLWISAKDGVEYGIADSIGDFSPPLGTQIFNI